MSDTSDAHVNTSGWLPICQAPKDGTKIIALLEGEKTDDDVAAVSWLEEDKDGKAGWWDDYGGMCDVNWWMPMPEKPKNVHFCVQPDIGCKWYCEYNSFGHLYVHSGQSKSMGIPMRVRFCPFCGVAE